MPYHEPMVTDEDGEAEYQPGLQYYNQEDMAPFRSNENAFVKHLTERHIPGELGDEHKKEWIHRTVYSGKERSTAFFEDPRSLQYVNASLQNLGLIETLHLDELKWSQVYDMIDIAVTTQGQHGNMIHALTIKRQEFADKTKRTENRSMFGGLLKKKEPEEQSQQRNDVIRY